MIDQLAHSGQHVAVVGFDIVIRRPNGTGENCRNLLQSTPLVFELLAADNQVSHDSTPSAVVVSRPSLLVAAAGGARHKHTVIPSSMLAQRSMRLKGAMGITNAALDLFVAQDLSKLDRCDAPDLSQHFDQVEHWISNFIFSSIFVANVRAEVKPHLFGILHRAQMSLIEYESGRTALLNFLEAPKERIPSYFRALYHFQAAVALTYQAYDFYFKITKDRMYEPNDGSPLQRLARVYNISKHLEEESLTPGQLQHVWLTNTGIRTTPTELSWREFADLLIGNGHLAEALSTAGQKRTA